MHSLETLAKTTGKSVTDIMEPHKEVLQDMIPPKKHLLRHQPANAQIGLMVSPALPHPLYTRMHTPTHCSSQTANTDWTDDEASAIIAIKHTLFILSIQYSNLTDNKLSATPHTVTWADQCSKWTTGKSGNIHPTHQTQIIHLNYPILRFNSLNRLLNIMQISLWRLTLLTQIFECRTKTIWMTPWYEWKTPHTKHEYSCSGSE